MVGAAFRGIEQAVRTDPANVELRLHLASLRLTAGRADENLDRRREFLARHRRTLRRWLEGR